MEGKCGQLKISQKKKFNRYVTIITPSTLGNVCLFYLFVISQVFTRDTPKWLPHATANKPSQPSTEYHGPAKRMEHGQERTQTIYDSQRNFAAQFGRSPAERGAGRAAEARIQGGSRWASKPVRPPKNPGESPVGSRWAVKPPPQENNIGVHMSMSQNATGAFGGGVQGHYGANRLGSHKEDRLRNEQDGGTRSDRAGIREGAAAGRGGGALGTAGGVGQVNGGVSGGSGRGDGGQHRGKISASAGSTSKAGVSGVARKHKI